jgi:hypothetical protein
MTAQIKQFSARGAEASLLRQRKYGLVRQFGLPENLLGGSLAPTRRRCGKPNCHCRNGEGHLQWSVTFCKSGKKRVERVPLEWLEELEKTVLQTQSYLAAVREVMAINLELLAQTREQERPRRVRRRREKCIGNEKDDQLFPPAIDPLHM